MQSLESVAFTFLLPVGAAYDPIGRAGLTSMTCDMALRGCGNLDSRQYVERLESLGIETGEAVSVPAKRVPYFKAGKEIRERLNDG